jgi:hypothetical protein
MSASVPDLIALPAVPRALVELTGQSPPPPYQAIYRAALNALIPTVTRRTRHFVERARLPEVARAFGLRVPEPTRSRRRKATADVPANELAAP